MEVKKRIISNSLFGWLHLVINIIVVMTVTPILLKHIGKERYGVWVLIAQFMGIYSLLDFGVASSISRFVSRYRAKNDLFSLSKVISLSVLIFLISGFSVAVITLIMSPFLGAFFNISSAHLNIASLLFLIVGFSVAVGFPLRIGRGLLQGIHRFDLVSVYQTMGLLLRLSLIVLLFCLLGHGNLVTLGIITVCSILLPEIIIFFKGFRNNPGIQIRKSLIDINAFKEVSSLGLSAFLISSGAILYNQSQILVVGNLLNMEAVAMFSIPLLIMRYASLIVTKITAQFVPLSSQMDALSEGKSLQRLNILGVRFVSSLSLFIFIGILFWGRQFLSIWLTNSVFSMVEFKYLHYILIIMALGYALGIPQHVSRAILIATGEHWKAATVSVLTALTGLLLGIFLIKYTPLGLVGMAIGWATTFIMRGVFIYPFIILKKFKINIWYYLEKAYLPSLTISLFFALVIYGIHKHIFIKNILDLFVAGVVFVSIYSILFYSICLEKNHRLYLKKLIFRRISS